MVIESRGRLLVWHLFWNCLCIFTCIYDYWAFKQSGGKGYEDCLTYGGPWKYLTYWNMSMQIIYSLLAAIVDILPRKIREKGQAWRNLLLVSMVTPVPFFVVVVFWSLYFTDRDLIHPAELDTSIPPSLNHLFHTNVLVCSLLELGIVQLHPRPARLHCITALSLFYLAYFCYSLSVFYVSGIWAYAFLNNLPIWGQITFFTTSFFFLVIFYFIGEAICKCRAVWKNAVITALIACCLGILYKDCSYHLTAPFIPHPLKEYFFY